MLIVLFSSCGVGAEAPSFSISLSTMLLPVHELAYGAVDQPLPHSLVSTVLYCPVLGYGVSISGFSRPFDVPSRPRCWLARGEQTASKKEKISIRRQQPRTSEVRKTIRCFVYDRTGLLFPHFPRRYRSVVLGRLTLAKPKENAS